MRYFKILNNERYTKFLIAKSIEVEDFKDLDLEELFNLHSKYLKILYKNLDKEDIQIASPNLLDLKIEIANRIFKNCYFCEHRCYVNREKEKGFCRIRRSCYSTEFLHYGEEDILIPSHTIFFCGCNFKCVFCQNWDISQVYFENIPHNCKIYNPKEMAKIIEVRRGRNVNFVGGEPTPHLHKILETLKYININIPIVWNSNFYLTPEGIELLKGVVDIYLTDFKFGNNKCGERLSKVKNYFDILKRNHLLIKDEEIIIRHLVMPNHLICCTNEIFRFISKNLKNALVNVMFQYRPEYKAKFYRDISRTLTYDEMILALELAKKYKLNLI